MKIKRYFINYRNQMVMSSKFQKWVANTPVIRLMAKKDGEKIFDLMSGFVYSQTLLAMTELDLFNYLKGEALSLEQLSKKTLLKKKSIEVLCQSGCAIGVLELFDNEKYCLSRLGASVASVPGLQMMIRHHRLFYEDLVDPVRLLKNEADTHMSKYWPYVLSGDQKGKLKSEVAGIYSDLMRASQKLVSEETIRVFSFSSAKKLLDLGGGTGAFIEEVAKVTSGISFCLFDLPEVVEKAEALPFFNNKANEVSVCGGSFKVDTIPKGFDTITLIRVLYDHDDAVVIDLLKKVYDALPDNGQVVISEPMSGGKAPTRYGDSYFGFYTTAMSTGRPRSMKTHEAFLKKVGFQTVKKHKGTRQFVTEVISAKKKL